jgi:hypothetical protein
MLSSVLHASVSDGDSRAKVDREVEEADEWIMVGGMQERMPDMEHEGRMNVTARLEQGPDG